MSRQTCLMLGAGHTPVHRRLSAPTSASEETTTWVKLDMNPDCKPDILFDLNDIEQGKKLPIQDDSYDEIHAYEVLEHYGHQGDYKGFFTGMFELWRVLKPEGLLIGTCPAWDKHWAWADPGHTRIITEGTLSYLTREQHALLGTNPATDYGRYVHPRWWAICFFEYVENTGGLRWAMRKLTDEYVPLHSVRSVLR